MTKFGLAAILALTSSAACAGSVFEVLVNGGTARIRIDESCRDSLCASVSWKERGSRSEPVEYKLPEISAKTISKLFEGGLPGWKPTEPDYADDGRAATPPGRDREPVRPRAERNPAPAPTTAPATAPAGPVATLSDPPAGAATADPAPQTGPSAVPADELKFAGGPPAQSTTSSPTVVAPARTVVAPVQPGPAAVSRAPAPAPASATTSSRSSPVGEWRIEDGDGQVRIEECGANLCGYISAAKHPNDRDRKNPDPALRNRSVIGMPILINMKPSGNRWKGRIYNVKDGGTYDVSISLKSADTLRVEGCALGGLVCGGQSWSRVN